MSKVISMYVRDNKRNKVGCVVAVKNKNEISFGWSKCCTKLRKELREKGEAPDVFDKNRALISAIGRANSKSKMTIKTMERFLTSDYIQMNGQVPHLCRQAFKRLFPRVINWINKPK